MINAVIFTQAAKVLAGTFTDHNLASTVDIAQHVAVRVQRPVGIFSLEMSKEALVMRLLCAEAKVNGHKLQAV